MKVVLGLTHDCNLDCSYCYGGSKSKDYMSFDLAKRIVDYAFGVVSDEHRIEFSFFGGEPLLCFDIIKGVVEYINAKKSVSDKDITLSVTSNGTLITDAILDFFYEESMSLCISIDGPKHIHDLNRKLSYGQGSFDLIIDNLLKAKKRLSNLQVNAVYTQKTIDYLPDTIAFFKSLGITSIHINPNITETWDPRVFPKIPQIFMKIAEEYIQCYRNGYELAINCLDSKIILFLKGGYQAVDKCGMGESELAFSPSGNIYPCERFIGEDNDLILCIGNIEKGINTGKQCEIVKNRGNRNPECKSCKLQKYCMNWCGCTNYLMTNKTDIVDPLICEIEKATIYSARHVLTSLQNNELFLSHYMKYAQADQHSLIIK